MRYVSVMNGKKAQQSTFRYSTVEAALCDAFWIEEEGMKPFQAKIRHLRSIGVPGNLPRPGSGKKIEYSLDQVLEVAFALTLEQYGTTPRLAANFGPDIVHSIRLTRIRNPRDDFYVILERAAVPPGLPSLGYMLMPGFEQLTFWLKDRLVDREDDALLILNASGLMRKVEQALISHERS